MKLQRTANTVRNIKYGAISRFLLTVMPFFTRTIILYFLGADYLGLGSLFSSILSFLGLAELGFSSAMVYSMYKPIAEEDGETICALLNLYKKYYRLIGIIILGLGLLLIPFLQQLIKGDVPEGINLYLLYTIFLSNTVLSYFLFAYRGSLLTAHQRNDVDSKITALVSLSQYVIQVLVLLLFRNYYIYIICLPLATIATNYLRLIAVKRRYPQYSARGKVSKELSRSISKRVKALIGAKLNTVVLNASDNIVMSAFFGLTVIAIYNNYFFIMSAITSCIGIIYSSITAGIGNSLVTETEEKNYADYNKFSFLNAWIVGWCAVCLLCLYQPFMHIWTRGELVFPFYVVIQIVVYFYLYMIRKIVVNYKDAAGIWWEDRFRPYVCMAVNIISNIILVQLIGVSGIVLSTILSLAISIPWENSTIFRYVFHRSARDYYVKMFRYAGITILSAGATLLACHWLPFTVLGILLRGAICFLLPNLIWILFNFKRHELKESVQLICSILKFKLPKLFQ